MKEIEGKLSAKGLKVALVASRFNSFLVEQLVKGAADAFNRLGGDARRRGARARARAGRV